MAVFGMTLEAPSLNCPASTCALPVQLLAVFESVQMPPEVNVVLMGEVFKLLEALIEPSLPIVTSPVPVIGALMTTGLPAAEPPNHALPASVMPRVDPRS